MSLMASLLGTTTIPIEYLSHLKAAATFLLLALFWGWETWLPFFERPDNRFRHAGRNLALAICNTAVLAAAFSIGIVAVADWANENSLGLLRTLALAEPARLLLALVMLDGWMYLWHRANHTIPFLWRFHRMHHSDDKMDVTTALRFHLGEHIGSSVLRAGLIPVLGFEVWQLIVYDTLLIGVTLLHHANVSLRGFDRWLCWFIVTPYMHKVHHSNWRPETDSNFSTVLSLWDRLAGTFRMRTDPATLQFGLKELAGPRWQSWRGMWLTPFVKAARPTDAAASTD
jgi:sterol desaturase/sphingolipid hydroxylase (fatty acid hydroxylase superfamily)